MALGEAPVRGTWVPADRLVLLLIVPAGLGLLALLDRTLLWPMLAADAGIALVAAVDAALARRPLVAVRRHAPPVFSLGRPARVALTLRSRADRPLAVEVVDDLFAHADAAEPLPLRVTVPARGRATAAYHVRARRRGRAELGDHHVRYASPLGLWRRQLRFAARDEVRVYPDIRAVHAFELLARHAREPVGMRASIRRGGENEFECLREYQRDDEYRAVDWRATARRSRLIVRQYKADEDQSVAFLLDAGRLMTAESAGLSFFDHALNAALLLAHVATRAGDNVGLLCFSDAIDAFVPPSRGARATHRLVQAAFDVHPRLVDSDLEAAFQHVGRRVRKRSLLVLFTQIVDDESARTLIRCVRSIQPRHLPLCVLLRDVDLDALALPDPADDAPLTVYTQAAAAELLAWRDRLVRRLESSGALVLDVPPRAVTAALITRYLEVKARHLL